MYATSELISKFSKEIKSIRHKLGKSQRDFAVMLDLTPQQLCRYECGVEVPTVKNLVRIADALGVTMDRLVGRKRKPTGDAQG